jgi:hypothetical protein
MKQTITQNAAKRRNNPTPINWDIGLRSLEQHAVYGQSFTFHAIAKACGVTDQAVMYVVSNAMKRIRTSLQGQTL